MSAICLQDVTKAWGDTRAVDGVSFETAAGRFAELLGPSGCGKSTTLRLIAGLERVSAGRVLIGGKDVTRLAVYSLIPLSPLLLTVFSAEELVGQLFKVLF